MPRTTAASASVSWRQTTVNAASRGVRPTARRMPVSRRPSRNASASTATRLASAEHEQRRHTWVDDAAQPLRLACRGRGHDVERLARRSTPTSGSSLHGSAPGSRPGPPPSPATPTSAAIESASARIASSARGRRANASPAPSTAGSGSRAQRAARASRDGRRRPPPPPSRAPRWPAGARAATSARPRRARPARRCRRRRRARPRGAGRPRSGAASSSADSPVTSGASSVPPIEPEHAAERRRARRTAAGQRHDARRRSGRPRAGSRTRAAREDPLGDERGDDRRRAQHKQRAEQLERDCACSRAARRRPRAATARSAGSELARAALQPVGDRGRGLRIGEPHGSIAKRGPSAGTTASNSAREPNDNARLPERVRLLVGDDREAGHAHRAPAGGRVERHRVAGRARRGGGRSCARAAGRAVGALDDRGPARTACAAGQLDEPGLDVQAPRVQAGEARLERSARRRDPGDPQWRGERGAVRGEDASGAPRRWRARCAPRDRSPSADHGGQRQGRRDSGEQRHDRQMRAQAAAAARRAAACGRPSGLEAGETGADLGGGRGVAQVGRRPRSGRRACAARGRRAPPRARRA